MGDRNKLKTTAVDSQNFPALPDLRNYCRSVRAEVGVSYISLCWGYIHIVSKLHNIRHMLIYSYTMIQYNRLYNI